jgi:hypothetical protein
MKTFLAVFTGSPNSPQGERWNKLDENTRNQRTGEGMKAWHAWGEKHSGATVFGGGPLGKTKRVSSDGVSEVRNNLSGFTVIQAESQEAAAKLFENHPHFAIFPGDGVEIMEIMPIPGM